MVAIIVAVFIVVVIICSIVAFSFGRHMERETQSKVSSETIQNLNNVNRFMLSHTEKQQETWLGVIKQKDDIITSLDNENRELKNHLDGFEGMIDEDEDEEEGVGVLANDAPATIQLVQGKNTAASVALELHDTIEAGKKMLHAFKDKIDSDVYKHLSAVLGNKLEDKMSN